MSNMESKYTVLSGIFPEILTQKVLIQEPLQLLFFGQTLQVIVELWAGLSVTVYSAYGFSLLMGPSK